MSAVVNFHVKKGLVIYKPFKLVLYKPVTSTIGVVKTGVHM